MPIAPNSFVPRLIEQIFQRYECIFNENKQQSIEYSNPQARQLLIELDSIFGDVLKRALRVLDERIITVYKLEEGSHQIVEITSRHNSLHVTKLFPGINYCACPFFAKHVLKLDVEEIATAPASTIAANTEIKPAYTCEHVLSLRLAKLFSASCVRTESLPKHKFDILFSQMLSIGN